MSYPGFGSIFTLITYNNYWTRLSQNIVICQCLADQFWLELSIIRIYCCFSQGITSLVSKINDVIIVKKVCCEIEIKRLSYKFWNNIVFFMVVGFWQSKSLQMSISVLMPRTVSTRTRYYPVHEQRSWNLQSHKLKNFAQT